MTKTSGRAGRTPSLQELTRPSTTRPPTTGEFDWRRFEGTRMRALIPKSHTGVFRGAMELVPAFERQTGIEVEVSRDKPLHAAPDEDVYLQALDYSGFQQVCEGRLTPLSQYLNDPTMTAPDYDFRDHMSRFLVSAAFALGSNCYYAIPMLFESYILLYNEELLESELGGQIPRTLHDLSVVANEISAKYENRPDDERIYGALIRGTVSGAFDTLSSFVFGGIGLTGRPPLPYNVWFDDDWSKPRLSEEEITQSFVRYARLMNAGPPDRLAADWPELLKIFKEGRAVFYLDASQFTIPLEAPDSPVKGKVGYTMPPVARPGTPGSVGQWELGWVIPSAAENKDQAWYFIQFMSNKQNAPLVGRTHAGATRRSTWTDPRYLEALDPAYLDSALHFLGASHSTTVSNMRGGQISRAIENVVRKISLGVNPTVAAKRGDKRLRYITSPDWTRPDPSQAGSVQQ